MVDLPFTEQGGGNSFAELVEEATLEHIRAGERLRLKRAYGGDPR